MLLFHFPPLGGVSMSRNVRNVQYLPRFGWHPVVVAPRDAAELLDPDSLSLVSASTEVRRTRWLQPRQLRPVVELVRAVGRTLTGRRRGPVTSTTLGEGPADAAMPSRFWRVQQLVLFPDSEVGWVPFAVAAGIRAHRAGSLEAIYSTSAPVSAHLAAAILKRLTGAAWVAEFRDPWLGNPVAAPRPWLQRRLQARLERWIVHHADRLVFVSPTTTRLYRRRYPGAADMVTITNGHDRSEAVSRPTTGGKRDRFRLVWTGALYRPGELHLFLEALRTLADRHVDLSDRLEVAFYGHVSDECARIAERFLHHGSLGRLLRFHGFVSRRSALDALADSDAAIVMLGDAPGMGQFVPGKLFDYIGQDKQILAILPPGDARDILEELDWGVVAAPNAMDIGRAIERLLTLAPPSRQADLDGKYDRVALAERLAEALRDASLATAQVRLTPRTFP